MKPDIHPDYHPAVFQTPTPAHICSVPRSTITTSRTIDWETSTGVRTYPLVVVEVSSSSAPVLDGLAAHTRYRRPGGNFYRRYGRRPA